MPWGYVANVQCDPIEKKPFFHAFPGSLAYSFGMLGCDLHCAYCQNWVTSQSIRDPDATITPIKRSAHDLVEEAIVDSRSRLKVVQKKREQLRKKAERTEKSRTRLFQRLGNEKRGRLSLN